jgi:RimJ/RimL family protein N-acetyltransferase
LTSPAAGRDTLHEVDTERLRMRPLSEGDASLYFSLYEDPDTMRFVGPPLSRERAQRAFRKALASLDCRPVERLFLAIVEKASQRAIGIGALQDFDARRRRVQAGIMLESESRGRGFGKEILRALATRAFAAFPLDEVWVQHAADNSSARSLPFSLGFSRNFNTADYGEGPGKCVWCVGRETWCRSPSLEPPGLNKVDNSLDGAVA